AGGSVAGHLIECGAQVTGGLWHRWDEVSDLAAIGYPIAEVFADGSSVITKPEGSGGLVNVGTVAEQLVYEIDDPARYKTPDVDVDLTTVTLHDQGCNRVAARDATGRPPGDRLKVAAVYRDGWTASGLLAVVGRDARAKARAAGGVVLERVRRAGFELADSLVECLGSGDVVPGVLDSPGPPLEVVLRVTVRDPDRAAVERFCRELAPLVTSGPSGIAGYATGRPSPRPTFGYWPTLVPRALVGAAVDVRQARDWSRSVAP
ncbi:MAG: acyclic terpene utilization AtuA family protein, partial [Planctomycetaceae bacterium]|nr:acyclic terpene utilization AtuA family protein [Planctomycetaceae bacterium]